MSVVIYVGLNRKEENKKKKKKKGTFLLAFFVYKIKTKEPKFNLCKCSSFT